MDWKNNNVMREMDRQQKIIGNGFQPIITI
jgi:hypothetical protein